MKKRYHKYIKYLLDERSYLFEKGTLKVVKQNHSDEIFEITNEKSFFPDLQNDCDLIFGYFNFNPYEYDGFIIYTKKEQYFYNYYIRYYNYQTGEFYPERLLDECIDEYNKWLYNQILRKGSATKHFSSSKTIEIGMLVKGELNFSFKNIWGGIEHHTRTITGVIISDGSNLLVKTHNSRKKYPLSMFSESGRHKYHTRLKILL